jgi:biotin carboxyl carrier protein
MKIEIQLGSVRKSVEVRDANGKIEFAVDGRQLQAEAVQVADGIYSILIDGQSFEATIESRGSLLGVTVGGRQYTGEIHDPRQLKHRRGGGVEAEGRQQIVAPMPGKVVRVLAASGDTVEANKGVVVIEAMKMQNEVRSPKSGRVERILVSEGQAVNAGDVLAVIA